MQTYIMKLITEANQLPSNLPPEIEKAIEIIDEYGGIEARGIFPDFYVVSRGYKGDWDSPPEPPTYGVDWTEVNDENYEYFKTVADFYKKYIEKRKISWLPFDENLDRDIDSENDSYLHIQEIEGNGPREWIENSDFFDRYNPEWGVFLSAYWNVYGYNARKIIDYDDYEEEHDYTVFCILRSEDHNKTYDNALNVFMKWFIEQKTKKS